VTADGRLSPTRGIGINSDRSGTVVYQDIVVRIPGAWRISHRKEMQGQRRQGIGLSRRSRNSAMHSMDLVGWNASFYETREIPARKEEDAAVSAASRLRVREEGGCSPYTPGDPVNIPHDIENRGVATRNNRELNPQVSRLFPRPPQVTGSAMLNLSRWRHGFEPRWDYERKPPGQGTSSKSSGSLSRDLNAEFPENIPSQIVRSRS
jgi:hypothetical protein